jgi:hypothetical protein
MNPAAWRDMVERTRELELALGSSSKFVAENERDTVVLQRRCVRAKKAIPKGTVIDLELVEVLRPAALGAVMPYELSRAIGKRLNTDLPAGEHLQWTMLGGLIRRTVRILYISDNSSDHNLRFLAKFSAAGHDIFCFNLRHGSLRDPLPGRVFYVPHDPGIPNPPIAAEIETLLPQVKSAQHETRPDLVYAGPVQTAGYLAALSGFHPMIVMSWGSDLLLDRYRRSMWKQATEAALCAADGFVCDCDAVRNAALRYVDFPDSRIAQLPWGVTPGEFSPFGVTPSPRSCILVQRQFALYARASWEPLYSNRPAVASFSPGV